MLIDGFVASIYVFCCVCFSTASVPCRGGAGVQPPAWAEWACRRTGAWHSGRGEIALVCCFMSINENISHVPKAASEC